MDGVERGRNGVETGSKQGRNGVETGSKRGRNRVETEIFWSAFCRTESEQVSNGAIKLVVEPETTNKPSSLISTPGPHADECGHTSFSGSNRDPKSSEQHPPLESEAQPLEHEEKPLEPSPYESPVSPSPLERQVEPEAQRFEP